MDEVILQVEFLGILGREVFALGPLKSGTLTNSQG